MTSGRAPSPYIAPDEWIARYMSGSPVRPTRPTLLVFSLGPEADCRRRPLLPARLRELDRQLRERCLDGILDAGRVAGLAVELATREVSDVAPNPEEPDLLRLAQRGATFGQRLASTLEDSWRRNPDGPVVLVGGDIPELEPRHLRRALELLARAPESVVVGPSPDGGFYLLASARPIDGVLGQVRWCGANARRDLVRALERLGRTVHELEFLADLDRPSDLLTLLRRGWSLGVVQPLARSIAAALRELARPLTSPSIGYRLDDLASVQSLRGPPA